MPRFFITSNYSIAAPSPKSLTSQLYLLICLFKCTNHKAETVPQPFSSEPRVHHSVTHFAIPEISFSDFHNYSNVNSHKANCQFYSYVNPNSQRYGEKSYIIRHIGSSSAKGSSKMLRNSVTISGQHTSLSQQALLFYFSAPSLSSIRNGIHYLDTKCKFTHIYTLSSPLPVTIEKPSIHPKAHPFMAALNEPCRSFLSYFAFNLSRSF